MGLPRQEGEEKRKKKVLSALGIGKGEGEGRHNCRHHACARGRVGRRLIERRFDEEKGGENVIALGAREEERERRCPSVI